MCLIHSFSQVLILAFQGLEILIGLTFSSDN